MKLTERGKKQASKAGIKLKKIIKNESVKFYVSPYLRTQETYTQIVKSFNCNKKTSTLDHRIREQEFGNLNQIDSKVYKQRVFIGRFYYRFNNGENGADCFGRVSSFLDDLYKNVHYKENQYDNYVIVCHGIIMRVFLMKMLNLPIEEYQRLACPDNCKLWVLEKENKGKHQRRAVSLTDARYRGILSNNYNTNTKESTNDNNIKEEKVTKNHKRTFSTIRPIIMKKK